MVPPITRYLAKKVIDGEDIFKAARILTKRMDALRNGFIKLGWPSFEGPEIGVNLFLKVPPEFQKAKKYNPDELFCYHLVQEAKVLLRPGSTYGSKNINEVRAVICQPFGVINDFFTRLKNSGINFRMKLPNGLEDNYARALLQIDGQKENEQSPARRYHSFVDFSNPEEILDFGIKKTPLIDAPHIAKWLGVKKCFLKLETTHPTGTVKDRSTELAFSYFQKYGIDQYVHASTGNTATSLVWGLNQYSKPFSLTLIIPGKQLKHHNFKKTKGLKTILLEDATYDEARKYREWYIKEKQLHGLFSDFKSYRPTTYQIPYLEVFEEIHQSGLPYPDFIFQTISGGSGIVGAYLAVKNAFKKGWLARLPKISIAQPDRANVITQCFNAGVRKYDSSYTQKSLRPSKAFAIRRGDATGCYEKVKQVLDETNGIAVSVSEKEITTAKHALLKLEKIEAGYTACVALAGIRKEAKKNNELKKGIVLVILTGIDRPTKIQPKIDKVITKKEWQGVVNR
jgi:threonine synthase